MGIVFFFWFVNGCSWIFSGLSLRLIRKEAEDVLFDTVVQITDVMDRNGVVETLDTFKHFMDFAMRKKVGDDGDGTWLKSRLRKFPFVPQRQVPVGDSV